MATFRQGSGLTKTVHALGPITREDGSALPVSEIAHYERSLTYESGPEVVLAVTLIEDAATPEYDGSFDEIVDIDSQTPGVYEYWYRTVDTGGRISANSEVLQLEILPPYTDPNPPSSLSFA